LSGGVPPEVASDEDQNRLRYEAEETRAAFIRARELAAAIDDPTERFNIYYGLWTGNLLRGELRLAREIAETFCAGPKAKHGRPSAGWPPPLGINRLTCFSQGDFIEAQANFS
jgi:hypothetical protein